LLEVLWRAAPTSVEAEAQREIKTGSITDDRVACEIMSAEK
jgi:hypothetical protein